MPRLRFSSFLSCGALLGVVAVLHSIRLDGQEPSSHATRPRVLVLVVIDQAGRLFPTLH